MSDHRPSSRGHGLGLGILLIGIGLAPPAPAQTVLGAHTLLGQEDGNATSPALTAPVTTAPSGSYLLSFSAGYSCNSNGPTDNKGNAWTMLGHPVARCNA